MVSYSPCPNDQEGHRNGVRPWVWNLIIKFIPKISTTNTFDKFQNWRWSTIFVKSNTPLNRFSKNIPCTNHIYMLTSLSLMLYALFYIFDRFLKIRTKYWSISCTNHIWSIWMELHVVHNTGCYIIWFWLHFAYNKYIPRGASPLQATCYLRTNVDTLTMLFKYSS